jgi:tetratricopeptide (TPR) repeat protein
VTRALFVLLLSAGAVIASARSARAEDEWAKGVPVAQQEQANAIFAEANQLFARKAHAPALEKYKAAIALWDHPLIRFNMAVTEIRLDRILDAADDLDRALRYGDKPFTPELYQQALDYQALIRGRVATVEASCDQADAHVLLDGQPWFDCPGKTSRRVLAGEHVLVAEKKGYLTTSRRMVVAGGTTRSEHLALVSIEGVVKLEYPYRRWIPWTIFGSGAALALGGLGVYAWGRNEMNTFQTNFASACPTGCAANLSDQPTLAAEYDAARRKGTIGMSLIVAGGATAVTGIVMAFLDRPRRVLPTVEVTPTPGGVSAGIGWQF